MFSDVKVIFFDVGNTLLFPNRDRIHAPLAERGFHPDPEHLRDLERRTKNQFDAICTEKTGIMLTNRGACFTLQADHPNTFGPDKRPMHTIIPALALRDGRCDMSFGVMGAHYQPMGQVTIVLNMLDYGMDVQQAIDAPRFFFEGEQTVVEHGTPPATIEGLKARGHDVVMAATPWGGAQTIKIDWDRGVLIAGSEPRKDGCALGY